MRGRALARAVIEQLAAHAQQRFADAAAWTSHITALGIDRLGVTPEPADRSAWYQFVLRPDSVRIATEGALWSRIVAQGLPAGTVV